MTSGAFVDDNRRPFDTAVEPASSDVPVRVGFNAAGTGYHLAMTDASSASSVHAKAVTTQITHKGPISIVTVDGELDISTIADFAAAARPAAAACNNGLIVDLSGVRFMSSSAITELVRVFEHLPDGASMALVATTGVVVRPVELSGVDRVMSLFDNTSSAAAYIAEHAGTPTSGQEPTR